MRVALWVPARHRRPVRPSKAPPAGRAGLRRLSGAVSQCLARRRRPAGRAPLSRTLLDGALPRGRCARSGRPGRHSPGLVCPMGRARCPSTDYALGNAGLRRGRGPCWSERGEALTGIEKLPMSQPVLARAPGTKRDVLGGGLVGDKVCDRGNHGGDTQAVYAPARADLDHWSRSWIAPCRAGCSARTSPRQGLTSPAE